MEPNCDVQTGMFIKSTWAHRKGPDESGPNSGREIFSLVRILTCEPFFCYQRFLLRSSASRFRWRSIAKAFVAPHLNEPDADRTDQQIHLKRIQNQACLRSCRWRHKSTIPRIQFALATTLQLRRDSAGPKLDWRLSTVAILSLIHISEPTRPY